MMTEVVGSKTQNRLLELFPISSVKLAALYLGVPFMLYFIYTLPLAVQGQFFFLYIDHPGFIQLLTNNFIHQLPSHLLGNVGYYLLVLTFIIFLEKNSSRFSSLMFAMFSGVAIISSAFSWVYFSSSGVGYILGFSAVVAGLLGYLIFLVIEKLYVLSNAEGTYSFWSWAPVAVSLLILPTIALGITATYSVGHISNGVGHVVGYLLGFVLAYIFR